MPASKEYLAFNLLQRLQELSGVDMSVGKPPAIEYSLQEAVGLLENLDEALMPAEQIMLSGQGLLAQNFDRQVAVGASQAVSGRVYAMLVPLRAGQVIEHIVLHLTSSTINNDATLAKAGIYDTAGNRLATSADQQANLEGAGAGLYVFNLTAPYEVPTSGVYYVAVLYVGTGLPTWLRGQAQGLVTGAGVNGGPPVIASESSQTDLDPTLTLIQSTPIAYWVGLY